MAALPDPVPPSSATIHIAQTNLTNLQRFNDLFYTNTISKCANAFLLLGKNDTNDPGMNIGINLICGALIGVGGDFGVIGCIFANYFTGLISQYGISKPPSLLATFASYITRIQAITLQADRDMAVDYTNPTENWYSVKSGTFDTPWGPKTYGCCLGQLATVNIPAETDPMFSDMMTKALYNFDQMLWWTILKQNFQINVWNTTYTPEYLVSKTSIDWINNYCSQLMVKYPATNSTWEIGGIRGWGGIGPKKDYYIVNEWTLGSPPLNGKDQPISDAAAHYLFIDTISGVIVNPSGLFNRSFLFNDCGIVKKNYVC
jgi:hypothetical protein